MPVGAQPPLRDDNENEWAPFTTETDFKLADFLYRDEEMSAKKIDYLLEIWALDKMKSGDIAPFASYNELYATIDAIEHGDVPWQSFSMQAPGGNEAGAPAWRNTSYEVWYRDPSQVIANILENTDFDGEIDYAPYVEVSVDSEKCEKRVWSDFMSGNFAWNRSVSLHIDSFDLSVIFIPQKQTRIVEEDPSLEGAMLCTAILGADKTTVSVATGHVEYHPLYLSIGNIHNSVRRAHRNGVVPIGFLAIPKGEFTYSVTFNVETDINRHPRRPRL